MRLPIYQVDAFTDRLFAGNPAAVVPLGAWLPDAVLQSIAAENNLSETAFLVLAGAARWEVRWFTPTIEVPLCGHATLASAFVLSDIPRRDGRDAHLLDPHGGRSRGDAPGEALCHASAATRCRRAGSVEAVAAVLGARPSEVVVIPAADDETFLALFPSEEAVRALRPDFQAMARLSARNVLATAPANSADFVSRMFAPKPASTRTR